MNNNKNDNHDNRFKPFPVECLPDLARRFVEQGSSIIGCDPSMVALPLLAGIAACIGSAARLKVNSTWIVPSILWCCVCVKSGSAKSPAQNLTMDLIKELQDEERSRYRHKYAKELKAKANEKGRRKQDSIELPPEKRVLTTNATVEGLAKQLEANPGLLVDTDELASWISNLSKYSSSSGSDMNDWLSIYGGKSFTHDRKEKSNSLYVRLPSVSICGGIQPERLFTIFSSEHFDSGLIARFLFAVPPVKKKRFATEDMPPKLRVQVKHRLDKLFELEPNNWSDVDDWKPRMLELTAQAHDLYERFHDSHGDAVLEATGALNAALSKLEEIPLRLSIVLGMFENPDLQEIQAKTMESAIHLTQWFIGEAKRLYFDYSPSSNIAGKIIEALRLLGRGSVRDIHRSKLQAFKNSVIELEIHRMVHAGTISYEDVETGGRPTRVYFLVDELAA